MEISIAGKGGFFVEVYGNLSSLDSYVAIQEASKPSYICFRNILFHIARSVDDPHLGSFEY